MIKSISGKLPVVMVTNGRDEMLCATLASLFATPTLLNIVHICQSTETYAQSQIIKAIQADGRHTYQRIGLAQIPNIRTRSVGSLRSEALTALYLQGDTKVLMIDGDVVFRPELIPHLVSEYEELEHVGCLGSSLIDVDNSRNHADFTHDWVPSCRSESDNSKTGNTGFYSLYEKTDSATLVTTFGIWSLEALTVSGTLSMWESMEFGVRGYDTKGALNLLDKGYNLLMSSNKAVGGGKVAFWHLYTKPDSEENLWKDSLWGEGDLYV